MRRSDLVADGPVDSGPAQLCEERGPRLLAEVDALIARLARWAEGATDWQPAETCRALVRRLGQRAKQLAVRIEAPLVVATLGGTGTGKSALVNGSRVMFA